MASWGECRECGGEYGQERPKSAFCFERCSRRWRDRRDYRENIEAERARSRDYYRPNREAVLARPAARRAAARGPVEPARCVECGVELEGRRRVVCSERCRERRFKRLHPERYVARERAKVERRRERRREARAVASA